MRKNLLTNQQEVEEIDHVEIIEKQSSSAARCADDEASIHNSQSGFIFLCRGSSGQEEQGQEAHHHLGTARDEGENAGHI
jgi:hypothetical protein